MEYKWVIATLNVYVYMYMYTNEPSIFQHVTVPFAWKIGAHEY